MDESLMGSPFFCVKKSHALKVKTDEVKRNRSGGMAELKKSYSAVARLKESDQRGLGIRHQRA